MSDLHLDIWGSGTPVVLVHGSLATGADEWQAQRPLADEGFQLHVIDRRGYGQSPAADGEDFLRDAEDIADLMGDGTHLVGHSYGGLGVLFAAARRPEATLSLTLHLPLAELAATTFPTLIVSGGHGAGLDAMCDDLAHRIGGSRMAIAGAGHEIQFTGRPLNEALLALWRTGSHKSG